MPEGALEPGRNDSADAGHLMAAHLPLIDSVIRSVSRQKRLSAEESEELRSRVYLRLLENGGAVLRCFQGKSRLRTYLIVVIQRIVLDSRIARWGKWRPSAEARRLGNTALQLEQLVFRDGLRLQEAGAVLRGRLGIADSDHDLGVLLSRLPVRQGRHFVGENEMERVPATGPGPEESLLRATQARPAMEALARALAGLNAEDRVLITMRFEGGLGLRHIAQLRGIDQETIYRRFATLLRRLRASMQVQGIHADDVRAFLAGSADTLSPAGETMR